MLVEDNLLPYGKFKCDCCGVSVQAHTYEEVLKYEKKCIDCSIISATGGLKETTTRKSMFKDKKSIYSLDMTNPNNLRRDIKKSKCKSKRVLTTKEKEQRRQAEEDKWQRIRDGYKTAIYPRVHNTSDLD